MRTNYLGEIRVKFGYVCTAVQHYKGVDPFSYCAVHATRIQMTLNSFTTAVPFWETNYLEFEWFVPRTGLEF